MPVFAAVDVGASGGRVMAGVVDGADVRLTAVHRFANGVTEIDGHLRWRIHDLYQDVLIGLAKIPDAQSIGIDTWGVDYGLLDADGQLLAEPIAYRDDRTAKVIDEVHAAVDPAELYAINGLQHLPFTTLYQLAAEQDGPLWAEAAHAVLLPDLIAYWLTGHLRTELTNASTTGLLDARSQQWATGLLDRLSIPATLLPSLESAGSIRGQTDEGRTVTTVASHDTASAVVAVPATTDRFAYVASGTWSLVGLELDAPVLTEAARQANFTNEIGRRRSYPIPPQRGRAVAAPGVPSRVEARRPRCPPPRGRPAAWPGAPHRRRRPGLHRPRPDARRGSAQRPVDGSTRSPPCAASSTRSRTATPAPSARPRRSPTGTSRSSTSWAAARRTTCSASSPPTRPACR